VGAEAKFVPLIVTTMAEHRHETDIQWDGIILIKNIGSNLPAVRATHGAAWSAIAVRLLLDVYVPTTTQTPGPLLNVIGEVNPAFPTTVSCRGALRAVKGEGVCVASSLGRDAVATPWLWFLLLWWLLLFVAVVVVSRCARDIRTAAFYRGVQSAHPNGADAGAGRVVLRLAGHCRRPALHMRPRAHARGGGHLRPHRPKGRDHYFRADCVASRHVAFAHTNAAQSCDGMGWGDGVVCGASSWVR
jgi:hypothetical protein